MDSHTIVNADCLDYMRGLPDGSVDLVLTSPPYEGARTYGIGFELWGDEWVSWAAERYMECLRVCRGLVAWVVEGTTRRYRWSATPMLLAVELMRRGATLRKPPIFHRVGIPGSGGPDWWRNDYEFIICATARRGKLPWSDNTAMGHPPKWGPGGEMSHRLSDGSRRNQWGGGEGRPSHVFGTQQSSVGRRADGTPKPPYFNGNGHPGSRKALSSPMPVLANPGNVIRCNVGGNQMGSRLAHENEAPFPERLAEYFIRSFCPPGGTVLDPFCGSGTTLAVATMHGRNSVGVDVRQNQCQNMRKRVAEARGRGRYE